MTREERVPNEVMNDYRRWLDANDCVDLHFAGVNYLYDTMVKRYPRAPLCDRILRLGEIKRQIEDISQGDPNRAPERLQRAFVRELNLLGRFGFSLWHLRAYESKGLTFEMSELAKIGLDEGSAPGTENRIRGTGFVLYAAATFVCEGFGVEFIARAKEDNEKRPDFFVCRDSARFACEATTRSPKTLQSSSVADFWWEVRQVVVGKREKFRLPDFDRGVLLIDCTPIYHLLPNEEIRVGGEIIHMPAEGQPGPPGAAHKGIVLDDSPFAEGLRDCERLLSEVGMSTIVFWRNAFNIEGDELVRDHRFRVLGNLRGRNFWAHFPHALVFPTPETPFNWH